MLAPVLARIDSERHAERAGKVAPAGKADTFGNGLDRKRRDLSGALGNVNPVFLFDLNREPRAVAQAYKHLIETFSDTPELREYPPLKQLLAES